MAANGRRKVENMDEKVDKGAEALKNLLPSSSISFSSLFLFFIHHLLHFILLTIFPH